MFDVTQPLTSNFWSEVAVCHSKRVSSAASVNSREIQRATEWLEAEDITYCNSPRVTGLHGRAVSERPGDLRHGIALRSTANIRWLSVDNPERFHLRPTWRSGDCKETTRRQQCFFFTCNGSGRRMSQKFSIGTVSSMLAHTHASSCACMPIPPFRCMQLNLPCDVVITLARTSFVRLC